MASLLIRMTLVLCQLCEKSRRINQAVWLSLLAKRCFHQSVPVPDGRTGQCPVPVFIVHVMCALRVPFLSCATRTVLASCADLQVRHKIVKLPRLLRIFETSFSVMGTSILDRQTGEISSSFPKYAAVSRTLCCRRAEADVNSAELIVHQQSIRRHGSTGTKLEGEAHSVTLTAEK